MKQFDCTKNKCKISYAIRKGVKNEKITLDEYIKLTGRKELINEIKKRIGNDSDVIDKLIVEIDENELNEMKNK